MKTITLLTTAVLIAAQITQAQITFERNYGGTGDDFAQSVEQTSDGGYIIGGETESFGAGVYDMYLIRTDENGDTLWTRTYGGIDEDWLRAVQQTSDGGYIITGYTMNSTFGFSDVWLIRTDPNGDTLWTRKFGGAGWDHGRSIRQTLDEGFIIAGSTSSFGAGADDVYLIKTDMNGTTQWTKTIGGISADYGSSVRQTADGGYIIGGVTSSFGAGGNDLYMIKTDANGDTTWTRAFGGSNDDGGYDRESVDQTSDGGYIMTGSSWSFGAGDYDVYVVKTDPNGIVQWTKTYGDSEDEQGRYIEQTSDSGFIISGLKVSGANTVFNALMIKTNSVGDTLWTRTFGANYLAGGMEAHQTSDQGYILAGLIDLLGTDNVNVYLVKTNGSGLITGLDDLELSSALLMIHPNPSTGNFIIRHGSETIRSVEVLNSLGERIYSISTSGFQPFYEIDLPHAAKGIYLVKADVGNQLRSGKLIIE